MSVKKRVKRIIKSKHILPSVGIASFLESTIVPIPLETVLIPIMQARREQLWQIATVTTLGCILGAMVGYAIGFLAFDLVNEWMFANLATEAEFNAFERQIKNNGFLFVFSTGVTPIPLQAAMLLAGVTGYSFGLYLLAVTSSRCIRYFGIALLVNHFGDRAESIVRKYKTQVGWTLFLTIAVIIGLNAYRSIGGG